MRRFGRDGLLAWILFLAAAKRDGGTLTYRTEGEGWAALGLYGADAPDALSLDEFFAYTGKGLKLTSKSRVGRVTVVRVRPEVWRTWNREARAERDSERKRGRT